MSSSNRTSTSLVGGWALPELGGVTRAAMDPVRIEEAMREGYAAGYEAGYAEGHDAGVNAGREAGVNALDEDRRHLRAVLLTLRDRLHRVDQRAEELREEFDGAVAEAALAIAAAVLDRELTLTADAGIDAIRRALAAVPNPTGTATVRLHPIDAGHLGPLAEVAPGTTLTVVTDPDVPRGGCVLQLGPTTVDASIAAALERVREVLCG